MERILGPLLILDDVAENRMHLAAIFICPPGVQPGAIATSGTTTQPTHLLSYDNAHMFRARFTLPADAISHYT